MKKTILLAAALLPGALLAQKQPTELPEVYASGGGNYYRSCIGGGGRCPNIMITKSEGQSNVIIRKVSDNQIELSLHKNDFSEEELRQILLDMNFVISEDTKIEESVLRNLKIESKFMFIAPGSYPIKQVNDRLDITLPLVER